MTLSFPESTIRFISNLVPRVHLFSRSVGGGQAKLGWSIMILIITHLRRHVIFLPRKCPLVTSEAACHISFAQASSRDARGSMSIFLLSKRLPLMPEEVCHISATKASSSDDKGSMSHACHVSFSFSLETLLRLLLIGTCIKTGLNKPYFHSLSTASRKCIVLGLTIKDMGSALEKVVDL